MTSIRTGELARRAEVGVETLRFYERQGLLPTPPRRPSGYRAYPADFVTRIKFIKRAQELGFALKEIKELLALRTDAPSKSGSLNRPGSCNGQNFSQRKRNAPFRGRRPGDAISEGIAR